jgi:hypothetical protein
LRRCPSGLDLAAVVTFSLGADSNLRPTANAILAALALPRLTSLVAVERRSLSAASASNLLSSRLVIDRDIGRRRILL